MALYRYVKVYPKPVKPPRQVRPKPYLVSILSFLLILIGLGMVLWVSGPIISFVVFTAPRLAKTVSPVPSDTTLVNVADPRVLSSSAGLSDGQASFTNPNVWFPGKPQKKQEADIKSYSLTIPKLKITTANVIVAGDDLAKSLIHYGGTAFPGEYGNTVIFGHSTLVQLYNPKDYKTIFATLPTIKKGDSVYLQFDGVQYRYVVYDMTITKPEDLSPLEQRFDNSYLTLITCVPPGTYLNRLNVKAKLEKI